MLFFREELRSQIIAVHADSLRVVDGPLQDIPLVHGGNSFAPVLGGFIIAEVDLGRLLTFLKLLLLEAGRSLTRP